MLKEIPLYLSLLINKYPTILSGRKNTKEQHLRIMRTKELIKKFKLKKK
tara:strand:+ start:791 stop:937 length:147 start_codon:yes stop_codon:yes gene_type:complete